MSQFIKNIRLTNFRNIDHLNLDIPSRINFIIGSNGIGKTNLLDALSRINIVRGLKGQLSRECVNMLQPHYGWGVNIAFTNNNLVQYGRLAQQDKMMYYFNKQAIMHDDLREKIPILWLSPVGEKLFTQEHKDIRRYIDNLVSMVFPEFAKCRLEYDKALKQRLKLLQTAYDKKWLSIIEYEISKNAFQIMCFRKNFLQLFRQSYDVVIKDTSAGFSGFFLDFQCQTAQIHSIEAYQERLYACRSQDTSALRSLFGVHRNKILVQHLEKKIDIYYCSTGEQKAILSHILFVMNHLLQEKGFIAPIILLDDAFAHYDNFRTKFLCDYMYHKCHNQFFLTDTTISDHMSQYPDNMIHHLEACLIKKFDTLF